MTSLQHPRAEPPLQHPRGLQAKTGWWPFSMKSLSFFFLLIFFRYTLQSSLYHHSGTPSTSHQKTSSEPTTPIISTIITNTTPMAEVSLTFLSSNPSSLPHSLPTWHSQKPSLCWVFAIRLPTLVILLPFHLGQDLLVSSAWA